jgi:type II secretory pathway component GspD/PulD (secretin)
MTIVQRILILGAAVAFAASSASAQRGGQRNPVNPPKAAPKQDTTKKTTTQQGVSLDFQDQDLKVVLDALAAAGDLNVSMTNIPSTRVTMHMGRPVSREGMIELVKSVAEQNGLKVTESPTLIQLAGPAPEPPNRQTPAQNIAQQLLQQQQQQQVKLFTYRLRHASAVQLAPVLTNLFSGFVGTRGGTTVIPNANGGFTTINTGPNGNITTSTVTGPGNVNIPTPFTPGGAGNNGGRGAGRGANNNNNPNVEQNLVNQALANRLGQVAQQLTGSLSNQAGDIRIIAEESSNSLIIRATESDYQLVQQIISGVDLRPLQVLIEVTIAEVQRTHDLDIGVSGSAKRIPKGKTAADVTATAPSQSSARDFILELTGGHGTINYDVAINALQDRGNVKVLSLPVIIAQNNRQASLNVGSSRPFVQISQTVPNDPTGRVQTVQYIDVGTVLTITPTINPDGYVNLVVTQTDNSATNQVQFDAPIINKREATTQIFIRDGQTTVIGGLAGKTHSSDVSGIPFLSRIPLIGPLLFGNTTVSDETTELYLFLTPHVITSDADIDKLRDAVKEGSDLLKDVNVNPRIVPKTDTLPPLRRDTTVRRDTTRRPPGDSLQTLRRRPPTDTLSRPDTSNIPIRLEPITPPPARR